jgi:hypothetical protein
MSLPANSDLELMLSREKAARKKVVAIRGTGFQSNVDMRRDITAIQAVKKLQLVSKSVLQTKYLKYATRGGKPGAKGTVYRIKCEVTFPEKMPDIMVNGKIGYFVIETAPLELMPHAVLNFLRFANSAAEKDPQPPFFQQNAPHLLAVAVDHSKHKGLAFQEYTAAFPHEPFTVGYSGRPSGPAPYISTLDNSENHGPGSQGSTMGEADTCFARIYAGQDVLRRVMHLWGKRETGFAADERGIVWDEEDKAHLKFSLCPRGECA